MSHISDSDSMCMYVFGTNYYMFRLAVFPRQENFRLRKRLHILGGQRFLLGDEYYNTPSVFLTFGVGRSELGVPGLTYPEIKGQWLNFTFCFDFRRGEINIFFDLSIRLQCFNMLMMRGQTNIEKFFLKTCTNIE